MCGASVYRALCTTPTISTESRAIAARPASTCARTAGPRADRCQRHTGRSCWLRKSSGNTGRRIGRLFRVSTLLFRVRRRALLRRGPAAGVESLSGRAFLEVRRLCRSRAIGASLISAAAAVPRPARGMVSRGVVPFDAASWRCLRVNLFWTSSRTFCPLLHFQGARWRDRVRGRRRLLAVCFATAGRARARCRLGVARPT